jgi:hypothetical protein
MGEQWPTMGILVMALAWYHTCVLLSLPNGSALPMLAPLCAVEDGVQHCRWWHHCVLHMCVTVLKLVHAPAGAGCLGPASWRL